jgi:hypothetical protein
MRNTTPLYLLLINFLFLSCSVKAQDPTAGFDTIYQRADRSSVNSFHFDHPDFRNIGFERFSMKLHKPSGKNNYNRHFSIDGLINNEITVLNWQVLIIGNWSKVLKPYYSDGSEEDKGWSFYRKDKFSWGEYFKGYIRSGKDTISNFIVYTNPDLKEIFSRLLQTAMSYNYVTDPEHFQKAFRSKRNFAITGKMEDIPFKLIYIEPIRMVWISREEQLYAVFATEDIYSQDGIWAGGQSTNRPFLLLKPGHTWDDEAEMIRLSMLTMLIADLVKPGEIY